MEKIVIKDRIGRGEEAIARAFSNMFPNHTVILSGGSDRQHDLRYEIDNQDKVVHLDINFPALVFRPNKVAEHARISLEEIRKRKLNQVI